MAVVEGGGGDAVLHSAHRGAQLLREVCVCVCVFAVCVCVCGCVLCVCACVLCVCVCAGKICRAAVYKEGEGGLGKQLMQEGRCALRVEWARACVWLWSEVGPDSCMP